MFAIPLPVLSTDVFVVLTFFFNVLCTNFQKLVILVSVDPDPFDVSALLLCTHALVVLVRVVVLVVVRVQEVSK